MRKFFSDSNPVIRGLTKLADLMWLNALFIITSLPVFTIGARRRLSGWYRLFSLHCLAIHFMSWANRIYLMHILQWGFWESP